ncbi:replicative DNA helicase [Brevundimonas aurantiaca]|uniref:replicative DNA helicase n=1 Tax=Brevundimonas aurantiaca TaxID=74316 RepID=UPI001D180C04|nr:DnaB-like helicase C-terminal domain-containing protein [Brevundimonas aurantiaca]MCC4295836.1 AAA family ATPase [Brevundimonas aurantiaca]
MTDPRDEAQAARAVPSNIEAEQALLGCVMFDNEVFYRLDRLDPGQFYEPFHQRLWGAIASNIASGMLAEPTTLMDRFKTDPAFEEFGGLRYLADLVDRAPPSGNAPSYARSIIDNALRRQISILGDALRSEAPDPDEDPRDIIGKAESSLLAMQVSNRETRLVSAGEASSRVLAELDAPKEERGGIRTGLEPLDQMLGPLLPGDLALLMGRPSMGKSAAAECIAINIAAPGWAEYINKADMMPEATQGVIQINGEMSPEQMVRRHLTDIAFSAWMGDGPKYSDIRKGEINYDQRQMLGRADEVLRRMPMTMLRRRLKMSELRSLARRQAAEWHRKGVSLSALIIDHVGLVKPDGGRMDRYEAQTEISNGLKELAEELQCVVIGLNQMNRENEKREDKRPQLSDLRDSGSWEQDADFVIGFYREAYYAQRQPEPKKDLEWDAWDRARKSRTIEAIVLKAREGECGTAMLWGDVARNAIRGAEPKGWFV